MLHELYSKKVYGTVIPLFVLFQSPREYIIIKINDSIFLYKMLYNTCMYVFLLGYKNEGSAQ